MRRLKDPRSYISVTATSFCDWLVDTKLGIVKDGDGWIADREFLARFHTRDEQELARTFRRGSDTKFWANKR